MADDGDADGTQYHIFLKSLDDSQLISHINDLSQQEPKHRSVVLDDIRGESTQVDKEKDVLDDFNPSLTSFASLSSDPFDDGLDDVLTNLHAKRSAFASELLRITNSNEGYGDNRRDHEIKAVDEADQGECEFVEPIEIPSEKSEVLDEGQQKIEDVDIDPNINSEDEGDEIGQGKIGGPVTDRNMNSEDEREDEDGMLPKHEFGDYATYFHNKHIKQQKADKEYIQWDIERRKYQSGNKNVEMRKPIFESCVIHVNGHTVPSINEIHRLVILYGGRFLSYLSNKGSATHIICDRLTPRKRIEFRNYRVVCAEWIVDCIAKNDLLDWTKYRLMQEVDYGQKRLNFTPGRDKVDIEESVEKEDDEEEDKDKEGKDKEGKDKEEEEEDDESDNESILDNILLEHAEDELEENDALETENEKVVDTDEPEEINRHQKGAMDAKHPDFLKSFFANSRLHHLSTWKADLRLKFLRKVALEKRQKEINQGPKFNSTSSDRKIILHIDFDCFFATASCLNNPSLDINKDPIAVTHGGRTSDIASCNYVARKFGLRNGMWSGKARQLCPKLIQLEYDFDAYEKYSGKFYEYLIRRGIFDHIFPVLIDEVLLDATKFCLESKKPLVDTVNELSQTIRDDIFNLTSCSISVGASHNVLLAKLALRKAKPNGQFYLHDNIDEFLDNIAVKDLPGIGNSIKYKLIEEIQDMSHREPLISDLRPFTETRLMNTFGKKTGSKLYQFSRGIDNTSIEIDINNGESVLGRKSVSVDVNFGIRFDTVPQVEIFLINLSKELHSRLISLGMCGSSITLRLAKRAQGTPIDPPKYLGMGLCDFVSKSSKLGVPTNDWGIIGSELKALFRMVKIPIRELRGIAITMNKLEDVENLKKIRQMRLPFSRVKKITFNEGNALPRKPVSEGYRDPLENENIDWEIFNELPEDIKKELQSELNRRGIWNKELQPIQKERTVLKKYEHLVKTEVKTFDKRHKAYLQQLIPTQLNGPPKYVRVVESSTKSPSKSPRKKQKASASPSPVKSQTSGNYDISGSYDDSVLNELPSSIKKTVLKDLKYKDKIKNFDLTAMREKVDRKHKKKNNVSDSKITQQWISIQPRLINAPLFLNQQSSYYDISRSIDGWVSMSLDQGGPHLDDVHIFTGYLRELLKQGNLSRCVNFINGIRRNLEYRNCIQNVKKNSQTDGLLVRLAINDWNNVITKYIVPVVNDYCTQNYIDTII